MEEDKELTVEQKIRGLKTVFGRGEALREQLDQLFQQLHLLGCFDGNPKIMREAYQVALDEISKGALSLGLFGSRTKGTQEKWKSDLDMVSINPKAGIKLPDAERVGSVNYWSTKAIGMSPERWIQIQRFRDKNPFGNINKKIVKEEAIWIWELVPEQVH